MAFKGRGVVAFDLAGAEYNFPAKKHKEAFYKVIDAHVAATIHAGEAYGAESIAQALHYCRADRIGHGTRLFEDPELERYVTDRRIPLEICLTSNVQTHAVPSIRGAPGAPLLRPGHRGLPQHRQPADERHHRSPRSTGWRTRGWASRARRSTR